MSMWISLGFSLIFKELLFTWIYYLMHQNYSIQPKKLQRKVIFVIFKFHVLGLPIYSGFFLSIMVFCQPSCSESFHEFLSTTLIVPISWLKFNHDTCCEKKLAVRQHLNTWADNEKKTNLAESNMKIYKICKNSKLFWNKLYK